MFNLSALLLAACIGASQTSPRLPSVAIIIDDIGYSYANSRDAIEIPQDFAYAILPFSPHAKEFAAHANTLGKEVLLHLPMEANSSLHPLGPGGLTTAMSRNEIEIAVAASLATVPQAIGINNHMGSRLTADPTRMSWLMQAIRKKPELFFVDSRTSAGSVALRLARQSGIEATGRDVFLDHVRTPAHIKRQLQMLVDRAQQRGHALAIAHPHRVTIRALREWRALNTEVELIRLSEYILRFARPSVVASAKVDSSALATAECCDDRRQTGTTQHPHAHR